MYLFVYLDKGIYLKKSRFLEAQKTEKTQEQERIEMKVYTEIPTNPEAYLEQSRISLMEIFVKIFRGFYQLNTFAKSSAIDVRLSSKYTSEICRKLISISLRNIV